MATFRQVAARLGVARCTLEDIDPRYHAAASLTQSRSVLQLLQTATFTELECAEAMRLVVACKWHGDDGEKVSEGVLDKSSAVRADKRRKTESSMQNFAAFVDYMTEAQWSSLLSDKLGFHAIRDVLICILASLGCRNMDEHTAKLVASLLLLLTRSWDDCVALSATEKAKVKQDFKDEFKRQLRSRAQPKVWQLSLPSDWTKLRAAHADFFAEVYGEELPVKCKVNWQKLVNLNGSFKCRGAQASGPLALAVVRPQAASPAEQMGNMMMKAMQQQQNMFARQEQLQSSVMDFLLRRGGGSLQAGGSPAASDIDLRFLSQGKGEAASLDSGGADDPGIQLVADVGTARRGAASGSWCAEGYPALEDRNKAEGSQEVAADALVTPNAKAMSASQSGVGLQALLVARAKASAAKKAKEKAAAKAAAAAAAPEKPDTPPLKPDTPPLKPDTPPLKKKKKMKKKKEVDKLKRLLGGADACASVGKAHQTGGEKKGRPRKAETDVAPAMAPATLPCKAPAVTAKMAGGADQHDKLLKLCSVSLSKTRLEICGNTSKRTRLCVLTQKVVRPDPSMPRLEKFVKKVRAMVDKGTTKSEIQAAWRDWFPEGA